MRDRWWLSKTKVNLGIFLLCTQHAPALNSPVWGSRREERLQTFLLNTAAKKGLPPLDLGPLPAYQITQRGFWSGAPEGGESVAFVEAG